ncbi:hypothetical protein [Oceanobacillus profundus]|uniref:hypothetical protein n=1 Tax=Oceanobacillus TaxID=182709 RepID=UPI0026E1422F|nr:hypothetical protein [Oceanobacillus profundus]MDO6448102.1 hypothetical protein [Oceanobacillus profundus]
MYEWLLDYQKLSNEIDYLEYKLEREKRELKRWSSGDLYNVKLNENSIASGLEDTIFNIEYELAHKMNELLNAERLIKTFKGLENQILFYKYVKGKTLNDVAIELGYSPGHIYNKHAEIMKRIDFAYKINLS